MRIIDNATINDVSVNKRYVAIDQINDVKILDYNNSYGYFNLRGLYWADGYHSYIEVIEYLIATHNIIEFNTTDEMEKFLFSNYGLNFAIPSTQFQQ